MKNNVLVPLKRNGNEKEGVVEKMRHRLERHTKYWPLTISTTVMFNLLQVLFTFCFSVYKQSNSYTLLCVCFS